MTFTYEEQVDIVKQIAMRIKPIDIRKYIRQKYNKDLKPSNLSQYSRSANWQPMIERFREEFEQKISEEDLASKRRRVQELSKIYWKLEKNSETLVEASNVISKIRDEVEGKSSGSMQINQYNQYNGMSDDDLRRLISENSKFLNIVDKRKKDIELGVAENEGEDKDGSCKD